MSLRNEKIASAIKRALSPVISRLATENKFGLASVSTVKLSNDLSVASVFVNILNVSLQTETNNKNINNTDKLISMLNSRCGMLRSIVAKEVRMRFTPELRFFYDDTLEQMEHIETLLNKIKTEMPFKDDYGDESDYDISKIASDTQ